MNDDILFKSDSETVVQTVTAMLTQQGCRVVRSFDLRSVLAAQPERACPCHGTSPCTCQYAVLLVYGDAAKPVSIIVHGHDKEVRLQLVRDPSARPDSELAARVGAALVEVALTQKTAPAHPKEVVSDAE